jgi:flagellar motor switch protein FliN/FliY
MTDVQTTPMVNVRPTQFEPLNPSGARGGGEGHSLDLLLDVPLRISVELGRTRLSVRQVLDLQSGAVVELDRMAGDPVDVLVNDQLMARGEVVLVDDRFGIRITEIITGSKRLEE